LSNNNVCARSNPASKWLKNQKSGELTIKLQNWIASRVDPVIKQRFFALAMTPDFYLFSVF